MNTVVVSVAMICVVLKQCYSDTRMLFREIYSVRYGLQVLFHSILHFSHNVFGKCA